MPTYNKIPSVDENYRFPPVVENAMSSKILTDVSTPQNISTTQDLNTLVTPGRYKAIVSSATSNPNNHYPTGAVHGFVEVIQLAAGTSYIGQIWTDTWGFWSASRRLYAGKWSEWVRHGVNEANETLVDVKKRLKALETGSVADVRVQPGSAAVYGNYRPDAWSYPSNTNIFWSSPKETKVVSSNYKGDGYVGKIGFDGGYKNLVVRKVDSSGTIDVSCINPTTSRHVTYRLQGKKDSENKDDFQTILEIWVGGATGNTVSLDTLVKPKSNMEWAIQINVAGVSQFVPYHGSPTAIYTGGLRGHYDVYGAPLDIGSLSVNGQITNLNGIKFVQTVYGRHPDTSDTNYFRIDNVTTISPDGMLQSETTFKAVKSFTVGSNYGPMTPMTMGLYNRAKVLNGKEYVLDDVAPENTHYETITEGSSATSFLMTKDGSKNFVAASFLNPDETLNPQGVTLEETFPMRIENRSTGMLKLYPAIFKSGSTIPVGFTWNFGAQWRYGEVPNPQFYK